MSTLTSTLLDFILSLLRDPEQAQAFNDHPEQALSDAGLSDVCGADVQAIMPMLSDYAPAGVAAYHAHSSYAPSHSKHDSYDKHHQSRDSYQQAPEHQGGYQAIEHIKYVQQNYSYSSTQTLDFSHSVWGDQYNVWADDSAVGINGSVVAGDDIKDSEIKAVNNTGDGSAVGFGNHVNNDGSFNSNSGDGNAFGSHAETDAFNTEDSYNNNGNEIGGGGNVLGDHNSVSNDDTGNVAGNGGNSGANGAVANHSFNTDDSFNTHTDIGPVDVGGVAIAGETATAGEDNTVTSHSEGVVQAGDDINHSLDDNFSPSDNFSHNDTDILSHNFNGNDVEQGHQDDGHWDPQA